MTIVYLDQNKWIELARASHGKSARAVHDALKVLQGASDIGLVCIPLSLAHYMETQRRNDGGSRARLAKFMWELSQGRTLAWRGKILAHEIDEALLSRFPGRVQVQPLQLLGYGMGHARDEPVMEYALPKEIARPLRATAAQAIEASFNELIEQTLLSRQSLSSDSPPPKADLDDVEEFFSRNLVEVLDWLASLEKRSFDEGLYLMSMTDIADALGKSLARHGIAVRELIPHLTTEGLKEFINDLPTQRIATQVLRQWARNRTLRPKRNDLYDFMALIPAIAYCDIVVTEKLFADLVNREGFQKHAEVTTSLRELPTVLERLAR